MRGNAVKPPRKPKPPDWSRRLARSIVLDNGERLATLADARAVILSVFGSVNAKSGFLGHTIGCVLAAAERGGKQRIAERPRRSNRRFAHNTS